MAAPANPDAIQLEDGWSFIETRGFEPLEACLDHGLDSRRKYGAGEWIQIYTTVYRMCVQTVPQSYSEELYLRSEKRIEHYLTRSALPALRAKKEARGEVLLKELAKRWENHAVVVRWVRRIFEYVDRHYVRRAERPDLRAVAYLCFKKVVFDDIRKPIVDAVLAMIAKERDGEDVDTSMVKTVANIFVQLGDYTASAGGQDAMDIYEEFFESPFIEMTAQHYRRKSEKWGEEDSFPAFMIKAESALLDEIARNAKYCHPQTEERLLKTCESEILVRHLTRLLEKEHTGLVSLLEHNARDDLSRLYRLFSRVNVTNGLPPVAAHFKAHIEKEGIALVNAKQNAEEPEVATPAAGAAAAGPAAAAAAPNNLSPAATADYVKKLLALHDKYLDLVISCFGDSAIFHKSMKDAFEVFVNMKIKNCSTAELFANYCDSLLNSSGIGAKMSEEDIETELEKVVRVFTYLNDKDIFQEFSRKLLSKRLLLEKSHSDDAERLLITKLKLRCGSHFTSKLEGMVTDMNLSKDIQSGFATWVKEKVLLDVPALTDAPAYVPEVAVDAGGDSADTAAAAARAAEITASDAARIRGLDFNVRVLTTGHWPTYQEDKLTLPIELEKYFTLFKAYYDMRTSQRVLRWLHQLGKGSLETTAFKGNKKMPKVEITVNTQQICILLLFNDHDELTLGRICELLGVPNDENIWMYILPLSKKYPLLTRAPDSPKDMSDAAAFRLNTDYSPARRKISVPIPIARLSREEKDEVQSSVVEDRRHSIESAIVRVMKQHKQMEYQQLVVEVSKLLMTVFKPDPKQIKARTEDLITREYLERDDDNSQLYKYLA